MIFFDTETCGLHGPTVLIQWADGSDGKIHLHSVWTEPIKDTLELIERMCNEGVVAFNLAFDWFHICQTYTTLSLLSRVIGDDEVKPLNYIDQYAELEPKARFAACLKPKHALDLMLHARKGEYQTTMNRGDIRVRRVPTALADKLCAELDKRIPLKDVYFARKKDPKKRWQVYDIHDDLGDIVPEFKDLVLKFMPSSGLKALAQDALGIDVDKIKLFADVDIPKNLRPYELGYAPFALSVATKKNRWRAKRMVGGKVQTVKAWPAVIEAHIRHWAYNKFAREYAEDDVKYVQMLYDYFDKPEPDDTDSVLAAMVGAVRWKGFKINIEGIKALRRKAVARMAECPFNFNSAAVCRTYLEQVMSESELLVLKGPNGKFSTKGIILEEIAKWKMSTVCDDCMAFGCDKCNDGLVETDTPHPAASRAQEILDARHAKKEVELYDKLLTAGRFHASFNVIGALSFRMSGADGLNPQGIKRTKEVRELFPLSDEGFTLCGGDFESFEICLMDAAYGDPDLREQLLSGKKIHALFGEMLFPPMSYEEILATKGLEGDKDKYGRAKNGVFAMAYGGNEHTLKTRVGVPIDVAEEAYNKWISRYKVWGAERQKIFDAFCSMRQPGGLGTKVEWHEPQPYVESMFGFKRYFTLENQICKVLFQLAESPPQEWTKMQIKVVRRDRLQTACGALRSALFGCAFQIQAANMRAAGNHVIQSSGATTTKELQRALWNLQPAGISKWVVQPMNVHDEIMCPTDPEYVEDVDRVQKKFVEDLKQTVPLAGLDWGNNLNSWADK